MSRMHLHLLSDADKEKFHVSAMSVLAKTGIKITHAEARAILAKAGAKVDDATEIVRFPRQLSEELLAQAPASFKQTGLNGKILEPGVENTRHYHSLILDPFINDYHDGKRPPKLDDVRRHTIIGQSLDRVSAMMRMQITVSDVPTPDCYLKTMEVFLCHLNKHITIYPTSVENCREWMDVYEVIADAAGLDVKTTPLMSVAMAVTSPLQVHGPNVDIMKLATERCYPVIGTVCTMAGTTSPYTLEGTALVSIVEALAVVLITQALKPGHPVTFGFGPSATDMRSGHDLYYKAEKALWKAMCVEMGKFYNLPVSASTGGSLTHLPDMQNGAESMAFILTSHLSGQHIYGGLGSMGNANGMSAEQIIMQAGLLDMAEYLIRDIDLSDQRLALDNIHEIGPGGNYLTDLLTIELMRSGEYFESPCFDLSGGYDNNAKGMYEIAHETAEQLIADYKPVLSDKVTTAIKTFFQQRYKDPAIAEL